MTHIFFFILLRSDFFKGPRKKIVENCKKNDFDILLRYRSEIHFNPYQMTMMMHRANL